MSEREAFSIAARIRSFRCAFRGVQHTLLSQHNAWIHAMATVLVVVFGLLFGVTRSQWCWLVLAVVVVWTAEALNTALEFLADFASPEFHPLVKKAKDVAAGAVLISAMGSVIIGLFVLGPYLLRFLYSLQSK